MTLGVVGASFNLGVDLFHYHATGLQHHSRRAGLVPSEHSSATVWLSDCAAAVPPPGSVLGGSSDKGGANSGEGGANVVVVVDRGEGHAVDVTFR